MPNSRRSSYSRSPSPYKHRRRSFSRSLSRSRSVSFSRSPSRSTPGSYDSIDADNPGNNLYVTGLSTCVSKKDIEKHFSTEGKVEDVRLVVDPWTKESRGFGFVTMSNVKEAECCIKYLDGSVLEGRVITVEKARRCRGRTPTPGKYLGLRTVDARGRSHSYSRYSRSRSPRYSSDRERCPSRSYSSYYCRRRQSYSSYHHRRRSHSPYHSPGRYYSRSQSRSHSRSPVSRRDRSYSPHYDSRHSPDDYSYRRHHRSPSLAYSHGNYSHRGSRYRTSYRSISPRHRGHLRSYSRGISPSYSMRSYSRSRSPKYSRRSYPHRVSPPARRRSASYGSTESGVSGNCRTTRSHSRSPGVNSPCRSE